MNVTLVHDDVKHIFNGPMNATKLTVLNLWTKPREAAQILNLPFDNDDEAWLAACILLQLTNGIHTRLSKALRVALIHINRNNHRCETHLSLRSLY